MDEILHHQRRPGTIRFPSKYQQTMIQQPWFHSWCLRGFCTHQYRALRTNLQKRLLAGWCSSPAATKRWCCPSSSPWRWRTLGRITAPCPKAFQRLSATPIETAVQCYKGGSVGTSAACCQRCCKIQAPLCHMQVKSSHVPGFAVVDLESKDLFPRLGLRDASSQHPAERRVALFVRPGVHLVKKKKKKHGQRRRNQWLSTIKTT